MEFDFDSRKTTQAAATLISLHGGVTDRMRLLKLPYLADRELLVATGCTLTGDRAIAMNDGPVLSHTYRLINGSEESPDDWGQSIRSVGKKVVLVGNPGQGDLTERELGKLRELADRYRGMSTLGVSALTHEFSEWIDNFVPDTSTPIDWLEALKGAGGGAKVEEYEGRLKERDLLDSIFSGPAKDGAEAGVP